MNIVKLLDKVKEGDDFFNQRLKGKYAYNVRCEYIIPLDSITVEEYNRLEVEGVSDDIIYDSVSSLLEFIDFDETERVNSIDKYVYLNKFVSDDDITIDELKRFRTWLAENLLDLSSDLDEKTTHMLQYYVDEMEDDTCKRLQMFGSTDVQLTTVNTSCGCMNNSSLYNLGNINVRDPLSIYKKNIYTHMVSIFSDIEFWKQFSITFIKEFKRYIDNIIRNNFTLTTSSYVTNYADCSCLNEKDVEQRNNISILNNLSKSLEYILNDDSAGHRNFISDALISWSSMLYERMRW